VPVVAVSEPVAAAGSIQFLVFGDWGTGDPDQRKVAQAMIRRVEATPRGRIDFILTTGDNFYYSGVNSIHDRQWSDKFEDVYTDPVFQVPFFPTLGNHDHEGNIAAQIQYSQVSPRWRMPARYYTFTRSFGNGISAQFFALDTAALETRDRDAEQTTWLSRELASSQATWKIVYGHFPLYSHSIRPLNTRLIERLEPILVEHGVDLYMAGHDHTMQMLGPVKGVNHLVTGGGAGPGFAYDVRWEDDTAHAATGGGFVLVRAGSSELTIEFVGMSGQPEYTHVLESKARSGSRR